jgi:hypothetical protein
MKQHIFLSNVDGGKLQLNVRQQIAEKLPYFNGKRVKITIEKLSAKRSNQQNSYLHLILTIFSNELIDYTGDDTWDLESVKNMCKAKFLSEDVVNKETGEVVGRKIKKTSQCNKLELAEFIDKVQRYAMQEFGIYLPTANEHLKMNFEED